MKSSKERRRTETEKQKMGRVKYNKQALKKGQNGRKEKGDSLLECLEGQNYKLQSEKEQKDDI